MKIFRFFPHASSLAADSEFFVQTGNKAPVASFLKDITVATLPDTALLIHKCPFFVPDFTAHCTLHTCLALRITRLGRSIHEQFAHRYYDAQATTLGAHFVAEDLLEVCRAKGLPYDRAIGFDNAVAVAEDGTVDADAEWHCTVQAGEATDEVTLRAADFFPLADKAVASISQAFTLRQGDLLLFPLDLAPREVNIDDRITLAVNGRTLTAFNVK